LLTGCAVVPWHSASEEGPNRNISIKDIERLEEMEALTTAALDAVSALARCCLEAHQNNE
jgi:hypothetical protein